MLFLPAAALCCLLSALEAEAAHLIQDDLTMTRRGGRKVSFSCRGTDQCDSDYVFWYQKTDTGTFTLILRIDKSNGYIYKGYDHPQENDFSAVRKQNGCELQIQQVKPSHAARYFCSCFSITEFHCVKYGYDYIFGSGTELYVTAEPVVKPVVSVYPAVPRVHLEGRSLLLCVASAMFPPQVRFSWRRRKQNGPLEALPPAEGEQLQLREAGRSAAILLLHQQSGGYKYRCYAHHEAGEVEASTEQEVRSPPPPTLPPTPPPPPPTPPTLPPPPPPPTPLPQVKLLCLLYSGLIVKSLLFCCGLFLLLRDQSGCSRAG
ncbi:immunoglobulin lambda-1 light chain-like [Clinocottus analis]|uniref:immunoglobulin lambda-1 light chain-like n=1 Tax=Clinocottus analis TaxID=304258 RepID=UPI0035BEDB7D